MFTPIEDGCSELVQGLQCHMPKVGWLFNPFANGNKGALEYKGVVRRSSKAEYCYWEPDSRWKEVSKWEKVEAERQKANKDYRHPELQAFINECWLYRLAGYWYSNNGEATYITGTHWFYLSCYNLPSGLPVYRDADRQYFLMWQYALEDADCYGLIEITKRRSGKSFRAGCVAIEAASRTDNYVVGIQSKTDKDAEKMFKKTVIAPFRKLPEFFRPRTNLPANGKMSASSLVFETGKAEYEEDEELASKIDYESSKVDAYDGQELALYIVDEFGKCVLVDVGERWDTHKFCLHNHEGRLVGKTIHTSTIEKISNASINSLDNAKKLFKDSDQSVRVHGKTVSGMYQFYIPADQVRCVDQYGIANKKKARAEILALRDAVKDNPKQLAALRRKESLTIDEAFSVDSSTCIYNPIALADRYQFLSDLPKPAYRIGNFGWVDGEVDGNVYFMDNPNGRWKVMNFPPEGQRNMCQQIGTTFRPVNKMSYSAGIDPYEMDIIEKSAQRTMSDGSCVIKKEPTPATPDRFVEGGPAALYIARPSTTVFYEDMIMALKFYGCDVIVETQKATGMFKHFFDRGYYDYLYRFFDREKPGVPASREQTTYMSQLTEQFIDTNIDSVFFPQLIDDWLKFDPNDTQPYDAAMAFGYAETLSRTKHMGKGRTTKSNVPDLNDYGFAGLAPSSNYVLKDLEGLIGQ